MIETPVLRRLETWLFVAAAVWLFATCAPVPPPMPSPPPTTQPSPEPTPPAIAFPLSASNGRFVDLNNKPVWLTGPIWCCRDSKRYAWPLTSEEGLRLAAAHGANYGHVRIGPSVRLEGAMFDAYFYVAGRDQWDVRRFNEPYFAWLHDLAMLAESLGIALEVDLMDGWPPRQPEPLSPWLRQNNVDGVDDGDCGIFRAAPRPVHEALIGKIVDAVGGSRSVLWHEGNEISICQGPASLAFVAGVERIVRQAEARNGFVHHLFGTNASEPEIRKWWGVEYITLHQDHHSAGTVNGKPTLVNEYRDLDPAAQTSMDAEAWSLAARSAQVTPDVWEREARLAKAAGTGFALWRGDLGDTAFHETLDRMKEITQ